jgi:hypothetical protein
MAAKIIPFRTTKQLSHDLDDLPADVPLDSEEAVEHSAECIREDFNQGRSINDIAEEWGVEASVVREAIEYRTLSW